METISNNQLINDKYKKILIQQKV